MISISVMKVSLSQKWVRILWFRKKPENLTILFKQKSNSKVNKLVCNRDSNEGGITLKNNYIYIIIGYPIDNDRLPGHSFLIDKTGENS